MAVSGVNMANGVVAQSKPEQKNKHSYGGYLVGAGTLGAGIIGYNSKSYLKAPGEGTDSFQKALGIVIEEDTKDGLKLASEESKKACQELEKLNNVDDVKKFLSENKIAKKLGKISNLDVVDDFVKDVAKSGFDDAFENLKQVIRYSDHIESTANVFKLKTAGIYAGVTALVGLGALALAKVFGNKNNKA